jgi:hypothetical protein
MSKVNFDKGAKKNNIVAMLDKSGELVDLN